MDADRAIRRAVELLTQTARARRISQREIEKHLGVSEGWLRGLITGRYEPKLRHILNMLDVLEVDPVVFFRSVFEDREEATAVQRLLGRFEERPAPAAPPPITLEDMRRTMQEVLRELQSRPVEDEDAEDASES